VSLPGRRAAHNSCDLFRVRKESGQREWLAPSISPGKWQVRSVRERPPVPVIVRWTMPQVYPKCRAPSFCEYVWLVTYCGMV
jgi:hypothetical protein